MTIIDKTARKFHNGYNLLLKPVTSFSFIAKWHVIQQVDITSLMSVFRYIGGTGSYYRLTSMFNKPIKYSNCLNSCDNITTVTPLR